MCSQYNIELLYMRVCVQLTEPWVLCALTSVNGFRAVDTSGHWNASSFPPNSHKICIWSTWPIALNWHFKFMPNTNHTITNPKNWINTNTLFVIFFCFFPYNCSVCWLTLFTSIYFISFLSFFYNTIIFFCCELSIESNVNRSPYSICIWGHFSKRARSLSF